MRSTRVFQADLASGGFPAIYPRFSQLLSTAGIPPAFFFRPGVGGGGASLVGERSVILDYVGYFEQDPTIEETLHREIEAGARVLCIAGGSNNANRGVLNRFLERYGLALLGERHFRLDRYKAHGVAGRLPRDQLPVVPADIVAATDGLAAGVQELVFEQPAGVLSTSDQARPLLWSLSNPERIDLNDVRREPINGDEAVAQTWAPAGESDPRLIVFGDGSWLVDELIGRADNERLALNLARWLAGERTGAALAAEAQGMIDRIELTAWDLAHRRLRTAHGPPWTEQVARLLEPGDESSDEANTSEAQAAAVQSGLFLPQKIKVFAGFSELEEIYLAGEQSKSQAKRRWGKLIGIRNRVAHADNRRQRPVAPEELAALRALDEHLRGLWRRDLAQSVLDTHPGES